MKMFDCKQRYSRKFQTERCKKQASASILANVEDRSRTSVRFILVRVDLHLVYNGSAKPWSRVFH